MAKIRSLRKQIRRLTRRSPGTVYGRFEYILNELDKRYETDHLSARPPEVLFLEKIDEERAQLKALQESLKETEQKID